MQKKCIIVIVFIIPLWAALILPLQSEAYVWRDEKGGTDVSILGLGMLRLNYASVEGDADAFANSDDGFDEGVDTYGFASFTVNGTLFHSYGLEGFLRYDEEEYDDDEGNALNFLFTLSRDENYLSFGDQFDMFADNYFSRYVSPFRGLTFHAETDHVNATTYGALAQGSVEKDELRADGTSGPYDLRHPPVVPGSEVVTLEVRNRNNLEQTIERISQTRNEDYTIDYDTGEIRFNDPVDRETFHGDPVFIVVIYRSEEESSSFSAATGGGSVTVSPTDWVSVGATYVTEFDKEPSLSEGADARQQVYSLNGALNMFDAVNTTVEYAVSQDYQNPENPSYQAIRATADGQFGERVEMHGAFHRTERDFLTFANPDVEPDEQELDVMGKYAFLSSHSVEIGYYMFQDNIPTDESEPTLTTLNPYIVYNGTIREHTQIFSRLEYLQNRDDLTLKETDDHSNIFSIGAKHDFRNVPALKKIMLRAEYEREDFEDDTEQDDDTLSHQVVARLETEPFKRTTWYLQQRERWIRDKTLDENTERQDTSEIGFDVGAWQRLSFSSSYEYRADHDLLADTLISERHTAIFGADYQPMEGIDTYGKVEFRQETWHDDPDAATGGYSTEGLTITGRVAYNPLKDLTLRLTYDLDQEKDARTDEIETIEDETEFRVNYAFNQRRTRLTGSVLMERDLLDASLTPEAKTRTITYFLSAGQQLKDSWDALAQYKREQVDIDADNCREDVLGEVGWQMSRFIKLAVGYQYSTFTDNYAPETDYTAHSAYIRLIGKL